MAGNTYRHPAVLANMAATLDVISGGRLEFGLGAGWHEGEHEMYGIPLRNRRQSGSEPWTKPARSCKSLWTKEVSDFAGRYYTLTGARCEPKPVQSPYPPITIGGTGEKLTLRAVAKHADRWNFNGKSVDEFVRLNGVLDEHCRAVGRDPRSVGRSVQRHLTEDFAAGQDEVRSYIAAGATHVDPQPADRPRPGESRSA